MENRLIFCVCMSVIVNLIIHKNEPMGVFASVGSYSYQKSSYDVCEEKNIGVNCRSPPISTHFLKIRIDWRFFLWVKVLKE